ncbi:hypothetical protein FBU30_001792 [Linnemannia zychae]|nr:hypothetical protein FBU30_001792 [Linnemannia zychae]
MLLKKITFTLAIASLAVAGFVPRTPLSTGGCPEGYILTKKICKIKKPDLCCPNDRKNHYLNDYKKCLPQLPKGCPQNTFECPADYGGDCCPTGGFCGTQGEAYGCYI